MVFENISSDFILEVSLNCKKLARHSKISGIQENATNLDLVHKKINTMKPSTRSNKKSPNGYVSRALHPKSVRSFCAYLKKKQYYSSPIHYMMHDVECMTTPPNMHIHYNSTSLYMNHFTYRPSMHIITLLSHKHVSCLTFKTMSSLYT